MRITAPLAAATVAVLTLTLSGCGDGDGDGDSKAAGSSSPTARPTATASKSPSAAPSRTEGTKPPSASPTPSRPSAAPRTTAPAPARTTTPPRTQAPTTAAPTGGTGSQSGIQGTWYPPARLPDGGLPVLTVSGGSFSISNGGRVVTGTIDSGMNVRASFQGETATGTAVLGNGGQTLTFNWNDGSPSDRFSRTKPA